MPNHILEYQFSILENTDVVQVTYFTEKKDHLTPRVTIKTPKHYCTSTRHLQ